MSAIEICCELQAAARNEAMLASLRLMQRRLQAAAYHQRASAFFASEAQNVLTQLVGKTLCTCREVDCTYDPDSGCGRGPT